MVDQNYLENNEFVLKVKDKEQIKEIKLKKFSFSIQIKLMKSGLLNELVNIQKVFENNDNPNDIIKNIDYITLGKVLELSVNIMYEMLPDEVKITKTANELLDTIIDGEAIRFLNWLIEQFGKASSFLAQENQAKVESQLE